MQTTESIRENGRAIGAALQGALDADDCEKAQLLLEELCELHQLSPVHPDVLMVKAMISIRGGRATDALCDINSLPDDVAPEVKVFCMYFAHDPMWEGLARELSENSPDEEIRQSMTELIEACR